MKQQSGEGRITWQFCDEMDNLMAKKPEISPVATALNGDGFKIDKDDCEHSSESDYTSEPVASRKRKTKKRKQWWECCIKLQKRQRGGRRNDMNRGRENSSYYKK